MGITRFQGPLIVGGEIFAAGTTVFNQGPGSTATVRSAAGRITAQTGFVTAGGFSAAGTFTAGGRITAAGVTSSSGISSASTIRAVSGFGFVAGNYKKFASGTYYGIGGATAPITSTGLTTISHIFMQANRTNYSTATTGVTIPRPCVAAGTVGSFYPVIFKIGTTGQGALNTVAGTFRWIAIGA